MVAMRSILLLTALVLSDSSVASQHAANHHHHVRRNDTAPFGGNSTSSAFELVARALEVLGTQNGARLNNPNFNKNEFGPVGELQADKSEFPPLLSANGSLTRRDNNNLTAVQGYSISPDLAEAARIVTEATPQTGTSDEQRAEIEAIRAKFTVSSNDTNVPQPAFVAFDGLNGLVLQDSLLTVAGNASESHAQTLQERDIQRYWMANIPQRGTSPFGPAGYKVWRNVQRDYGAKGDGVTDDTGE